MKKIYIFLIFCLSWTSSSYAQVVEYDSISLVDFYNQCNGPNWTNNENWLSGPVSTWYGITVSSDRVTRIALDKNNLSGEISNSLGNLTALNELYIQDNELNSLPDLSLLPISVEGLIVRNNYFTFHGLGQNLNQLGNSSNFSPQKPIPIHQTDYYIIDGVLDLDAQSLSLYNLGDNNDYSWLKRSDVVSIDNSPQYYKYPANISADTGIYTCQITNTLVLGLTLQLESIHVTDTGNDYSPEPTFEADSLALVSLYNLCNGPNWHNNDNWLVGPIDTWFGVQIENNRVVTLSLDYNNLIGELPAELENLSVLQVFAISESNLSDYSVISNLTGLTYLQLNNCGISDLSFANELINLQEISLNDNNLSDLTPLTSLTKLHQLNINNNNIVDVSTLGLLTNVYVLQASNCSLVNISFLEFFHNINVLLLDNNFIEDLAPLLNNVLIAEGDYISLMQNPLSYEAQTEVVQALIARGANVDYSISEGGYILPVNEQDSLALVALYNNCNGPNWNNNENWLTGQVNDWFGITIDKQRVSSIMLSHNNLSGTFPPEMNNFTDISYISVRGNGLNSIDNLENCNKLGGISASQNNISTICNFSNQSAIGSFELDGNNISDLSFLENLNDLTQVSVGYNNISDITYLVNNLSIGQDDQVNIEGNPLNAEAYDTHIPILEARGVNVYYDSPSGGLAYISPSGIDSPGNGSLNNPLAKITYAIENFADVDTFILLPGTHQPEREIIIHSSNIVVASNFIFSNDRADIESTIINNEKITTAMKVAGEASIIGITFENNGGETAFGGAVRTEWAKGKIKIHDCIFNNNSALREGGAVAVYGEGTTLEVNRCTFNSNNANTGSAIFANWDSEAIIKNSLFINNEAVLEGTVANWDSNVSVFNCSFINNKTLSNLISGFITADLRPEEFTPVGKVRNSIFWGSGNTNIGFFDAISDVEYTNSEVWFPGEGNTNISPEFVSINDFHLKYSSPLINSGTPDTTGLKLGSTDLDGYERIEFGRIDLGCFEGIYGDLPNEDVVVFPDQSLKQVLCENLNVTEDLLTPTRLKFLTKIIANETEPPITDLTGLGNCTNLVYLELMNNNIQNIDPLSSLTILEYLLLGNNKITSLLPLKYLTSIKEFSIEENEITNLLDLGLKPNLEGIDIRGNSISNFSYLANYPTMEWMYIGDNTATSLADIHDFPQVWIIEARDLNLKTMDGLTNMPGLNRIHIARNQISDISFTNNFNLSGGFEMPWNNVSDISPLSNQTELPWASLHHNPISDISPLTSSKEITQIWVEHCNISDITALGQLDSLVNLRLNDNFISTLKPLLDCDNLEVLQIANNPLTNKTIVEDYPILRPRLLEIDQEQEISDLEITYPNSTSGVVEGKTIEISWHEFGGTGRAQIINLDYSIDNGVSWTPILENVINKSSQMWIVPNIGGQAFLLKVEDAEVADFVRDTSDIISFCDLAASFTSTKNDLELSFSNTSTGSNNSWYWNFGDGNYSVLENPVYSYQTAGVYEVSFTAIDLISGCKSSSTSSIEAGTVACIASFDTSFIADSRSVIFTDLSSGIIEEYSWDFGDHSKSTETSPTHTYENDGVYEVCLTVRNLSTNYISTACRTISIVTIPDIIAPIASFSYTKNDASLTVEFLNNTTGDVSNWNWTFGDGSYYDGQESSHIYSEYGTYNVCLNVSNEVAGLNSSQCKEITVGNPPCVLSSNFNYILNDESLSLNVTNLSSQDADAWYWDFGDGTSSSSQTPVHTYSEAGIYSVSLTSRNTVTECFDVFSEDIIIGSVDCIADFSYGVDMINKSVSLNNLSSGQSDIFYWTFGDGNSSQIANPTHIYQEPGLYTVKLTVSDNNNICMNQIEKQIQIQEVECGADFSAFIDSLSMTIYLKPSISGSYTSIFWDLGDGYTSSSDSVVYTYSNSGYYTIGLTSFNEETSCMDYYQEVVMIASPGVDVNADYIYTVDDPTRTVYFHNSSSGDNGIYTWDFGNGETSTEMDPSYTYSEGGFYTVCLTAFGDNDIQSIRCKTISVSPEDITNCLASYYYMVDSISLSAQFIDNSIGGINTWEWNFEDGSSSSEQDPQHSWEDPGYYTVHLRATNILTGCISDYSDLINVGMENDSMITRFDYQRVDERFKASGFPVDFAGISIGDKSKITWDFGDGETNSTTLNPRHFFPDLNQYEVCLTLEDPNTGESSTFCDYVQVEPSVGVDDFFENSFNTQDLEVILYPNPTNHSFSIDFSLPEKGYINLGIFDAQGRCLDVLINDFRESGEYGIASVGDNLKPGIYFIILRSAEETIFEKIIKI